MKSKYTLVLLLVVYIVLITNSCKEEDVLKRSTAQLVLLDTTYTTTTIEAADPKVTVIEEFTGVRCINCAPGHDEVISIKAANPGRVIGIALHSIFLDEPYPFSKQELTTTDAEALSAFIGPVSSKPTASIDRVLFTGETSKVIDKSKWASKVNAELLVASPVNIHLGSLYRASDSSSLVSVTIHFTQTIADPLKLTLLLTESNIVTAQLLPLVTTTVDTNYVHQDVLRDVITDNEGVALGTAAIVPGRVFVKTYLLKADHEWNPDNMHIVAFIHKSGSSYDILQGAEIPFK